MEPRRAAALIALAACIACSAAAPMASNQTALDLYDGAPEGCYYNFQHYGEGDRIMTNEPCLNCTCHNRMLMCYLRVCPFTKPIGQDCTVEKRADQCCPIVTCPDVPVDLLTSTSTSSPAEYGATGIGHQDKYGCSINGRYFSEGSKVPSTPNKPCEHCYCIRNMTTCVMQECTLHVDGCVPIYHKDVCCPVRYSCDHPEDDIKLLDDMTTTVRPTPGFLLTTTTLSPVTQISQDCVHDDQIFADGALIKTEKACEHCYCMKGDIVCVVQECGTPMENEGKNCTSLPPRHGQCCPDTYICEGDEMSTEQPPELTTEEILKSTSSTPPRKGIEGSGYRNEPDEPYTDLPIFDTEGSGEDQSTLPVDQSESIIPEKQSPDLADEMFITTAKEFETKPTIATEIDIDTMVTKSETSDAEITPSHETKNDMVTESTKSDVNDESKTVSQNEVTEKTDIETQDYKTTEQPLLTTLSDFISTTLSGSLITIEDHSDKTTESTLRKEDDVPALPEATTEKSHGEITTEYEYYEQKVTKEDIVPISSTSVISDKDDEKKLEASVGYTINDDGSKQTTTEIVNTAEIDKELKENVDTYSSSTTTRTDTLEITSLKPTVNEIDKDVLPIVPPGRIPGEGDCLINGITYRNTTAVPSTNKCHTSCRCVSSIIKCDPIICSTPPEYANMKNCEPIYDSAESCCPTYICDHSKEDKLPESHSQMSGTESPKPIDHYECIGNECLINEDKQKLEPIEPVAPEHPVDCSDGRCEASQTNVPCDKNIGCQVTAIRPCEGENCKDIITPETETSSPQNLDSVVEKICNNDSCRRKEISEVATKLPSLCVGTECETETQTDPIISELTTKLPVISEEITKTSYKPTTISSESDTTKIEEKSTTFGEESTSKYDSTSRKVDVVKQEPTTESGEHLQEESESGVTRKPETFATERPTVEGIPDDSSDNALDLSTTIPDTAGSEEYVTTTSHSLAPEPTMTEKNPGSEQTTADLNKVYTSMPQTSRVESQGLTTSEEEKLTTTSLEPPLRDPVLTGVQAETIADQENFTGSIDIHNENTTPVLGEDTTKIERYTTESLINKEETDQMYHEKHSTTTKYAALDANETTETSKFSKGHDGTTSGLITEYSTSSPKSQDFEEKTTDDNTVEEKATTNFLDDSSAIKSKDESTTLASYVSVTSIDHESVTEIATATETRVQPTEQSLEHTIKDETTQINDKTSGDDYEISSITPELHEYEKEHQKTPGTELYTTENPQLDIKETIRDEPSSEYPATESEIDKKISETTEQDVMESLNGRATEDPSVYVHDDLQSVTSHTQEPELHATIFAEAVTNIDEIQSELAITEKTRHTNENAFEQDIKTETPTLHGTVKVITDSITTESVREEVTSEDNLKLVDEKDNIYTTNILNDITTIRIDATEQTFKENAEDKNKEIIDVVTQKEDLSNTERITDTTEHDTDTHSVTLSETHIAQSDSTESLTLVTEHTIPERHEVELTTTGKGDKDIPEEYSQDSGHINKHQQSQDDQYEQYTSTPPKLSDEISTQKQDLLSSITTVLPGISENILSTTLLEEDTSTKSPALLVTENIVQESLPTRRVADYSTQVTVSLEEEITTKLSGSIETITDRPDFTTKGNDLSEIEHNEKVTVPLQDSKESYGENETTKIDLISKEKLNEKATTIPEAISTEEQFITDAVTQKESELIILHNTKSTEIPEMLTSKSIITELETVTEKLSTSNLIEKITEEPEKTTVKQYYTESITESTGIPNLESSSKLETEYTKLSQTDQDILRTTAFPDLGISENMQTESAKTTFKTPESNIDLEENTINIEDSDMTEVTESPARVTEVQDIKKQTLLPEKLATTQDETLPHETPEIIYVEKNTEKTEYTKIIPTETGYPSEPTEVSAVQEDGSSIDNTEKDMTLPELVTDSVVITTESSNEEKIVKDTKTPNEEITEEPLVNVEATEKEIDFATDKLMIMEHVTEKLSEPHVLDDLEKTTLAEQQATKQAVTDIPHFVTDNFKEGDHIDDSQEEKYLSATPITPPLKVQETDQDITTMNPENSALESATVISEHKETGTTEPSELFIPVETSSHVPESIENEDSTTVSDEEGIDKSTEKSEISKPKPSESAITESPELLTTEKSSEDLHKVDLTVTTESSDAEGVGKTSVTTLVTDSVSYDISQKTDSEKTITDVPHTFTTIPSENYIFEHTTLETVHEKTEILQPSTVQDSNLKTESQETTSEQEPDNTVNINKEGEDNTIASTTEQYTETPKQILTELHKSTQSPEFSTESYITVTEKSDIATHSPKEPATNVEDEQTFTHEKHEYFTTIPESLITQQVETETRLPITLSTERLLTTEAIETDEHVTEAQTSASKAPELHKYTTKSDDIATHTLIQQTVNKETIQTELPVTVITSRDEYTQDIHHEVVSETKEPKPDYATTEIIETSTKSDVEVAAPFDPDSTLLQSKPTSESTTYPEYTDKTSEQMYEHSESTPYFVELEEHTHKGIEEITHQVYHEKATSTVKPEIIYPDKDQNEITTEKQESDESIRITTEKHETYESTKTTMEKSETDESTKITTEKQETDESMKITTGKQETDEFTNIVTEKQDSEESMKITTEKEETDELTKITTEKQETEELTKVTTDKQEIEELTKITTEKQETDELMKFTTENQEIDELTKITTEKQDTEELTKLTTEKQERDELPKITTEKQETDELSKITTEKQETDELSKITTEKQETDELSKITTEKQEYDETTKKGTVETSTSYAPHDDLGTPETIHEISTKLPTQDDKITTLSPLLTEIETDFTKHSSELHDKDITTINPVPITSYEEAATPKQEEQVTALEKEKESAAVKPTASVPSIHETTVPEEEFIPAVTQGTTSKGIEDITTRSPTHSHKFTLPEEKPIESLPSTSPPELHKPGLNEMLPTDDISPTEEDSHFPPTGSSGYGQEPDYGEEDQAFGPGTCRYGGKVYVSAQQIPRDDPCDFCFCFRSDIICLQQSCPPPIHGCHEEPIQGFCCPRYECPVSMATTLNITTTTTTTTTTLPPHFLPHAYKGAAQRRGCLIKGHTYTVGEVVRASSGPCLHCTCGGDGQMKCDPKACTPEPMLRQMIAAAVSAKRRR